MFCFLRHKALREIVRLFLSVFSLAAFSDGKFVLHHLYIFSEGLIFVILSGFFPVSSYFNETVTAY